MYIVRHLWTFGVTEPFGIPYCSASKPCSAHHFVRHKSLSAFGIDQHLESFGTTRWVGFQCRSAQILRSTFRVFGITSFGIQSIRHHFVRHEDIVRHSCLVRHFAVRHFFVRHLWIGTQRSLFLGQATWLPSPPGKSNPSSSINREAGAQ